MSDHKNPDEGVEIPEATPEDFGSQETKRGLSPAAKFTIVIGGVFLVIGASIFVGGNEVSDPTSSISVNADLDGTPGGAVQSDSPRYQELLEASNDQAAEAAAREGRTFIPTPERILRPIEDLEAGQRIEDEPEVVEAPVEPVVAPKPAPVVVQAPPAPPVAARPVPTTSQATTAEQQENPYAAAMLGQMSAIAGSNSRPSLSVKTTNVFDSDRQASDDAATVAASQAAQEPIGATFTPEVLIPAGDIIYAETLTSTNSDLAGSPVLVELTTGEYRGSRVIGNFTVNEASDSMVIEFNTLTTADGDSYEISAFAVDGMTAEGAVASDVDRRYLSRYGPILASAFISSYAEARSTPEQTLATVGDETIVISGTQTVEESLYAGLGAAAEAIGSDLVANAPKGPKVILRDGWPIALMFTKSMVAGE
jgi:intracellular multiplication protein IcmE